MSNDDVTTEKKKRSKRTGDEKVDSPNLAQVQEVRINSEPPEKDEKKKKKRKGDDLPGEGARSGKRRKRKDKSDDEPSCEQIAQVHESTNGSALKSNTMEMQHENHADRKKKRKTKNRDGDTERSADDDKSAKKRKRDSCTTSGETRTTSPEANPLASDVAQYLKKHQVKIVNPPDVQHIDPLISFSQLDIPAELKSSFKGFKEPTPIQACTWPPALYGHDIVGIAETGSGKTLAFGIPALMRLVTTPMQHSESFKSSPRVLVVAPTRELALQTHDTLSALGTPLRIGSVAVFGGVPKEPQVKMLKKARKSKEGITTQIIVGTPGRILDLVQDGDCDLSNVDYLVLDEADRMLDKGFENDITKIISYTKPLAERQTMMFSATWPESVRRLAGTFQRNPVRVIVGSDDLTANSRVEQSVEVFDDARSKDSRLLAVLSGLKHNKRSTPEDARILVFALYKKEASRVEQMLRRNGYTVGALHGDMSQSARMEALEKFKVGTTGLLVATDVAARGLDIPNVAAVINYTFPLTIEDYIHRIGRTGRGGRSGKSITFFTGDNHERSLAGEFARVLREGGFDNEALKKFPMTIKKKEHSVYGAFFRDDIPMPKGPTKIVF